MDDFHNINAVKTPSERILTNALHLATPLLDIQPSVDGGERQGAGARENRGQEAGEKRAGSGSAERAGIRREMQNANFCHSLRPQILSKTRTENVI